MESLTQAKSIIEKHQDILVLPSPELQGDSFGSALALFFTLKKLGKNVNMPTDQIPDKFRFLIESQASSKDFVISVDTKQSPVSKLRYEKNDDELKIYLTSDTGTISSKHVYFLNRPEAPIQDYVPGAKTDLVITVGAYSLEALGNYFKDNAGIIYESPVLNIDNQPLNEEFGEVNMIDITSSLSEITMQLIEALDPGQNELTDPKTATALLTGIVCASQNFRNPRTKPKTFEAAAKLIEKGADHQKIVYHLYKQKKVSQIKLLGRILEKISLNEDKQLYSVSLTENDFQDCQATSKDLSFAVEELKFNFRYLPNLLVLWENHSSPLAIKGVFCSPDQKLIGKILENFEGTSRGGSALFLVRESDLSSAQSKIFDII